MKKWLCVPAMLLLVLAFGVPTAEADQGVAIEVVNESDKQVKVHLLCAFKSISRTVEAGGVIQLTKSETFIAEPNPRWLFSFLGSLIHCADSILANKKGCSMEREQSEHCPRVKTLGPCSYQYLVTH